MKRNRGTLIQSLVWLVAGCCLSCAGSGTLKANNEELPESRYGWILGAQAYTFKQGSFYEALDKIERSGLKFVEAYPNQPIGNGMEGVTHFSMSQEQRQTVKEMLDRKGIQMVAYGVVKASGAEQWEQAFAFCKYMGVTTMTCEPTQADLDIVSALCDKYKINVAIHNHPTPTTYWSPDAVLKAIKGKSLRMGACGDIGHWVRSGLDPVEAVRKLKGHILHFHFKDLGQIENKSQSEVPWGQGLCKIPQIMEEMKAQAFKGMISVEYEHNLSNNVESVKQSVSFFRNELK